MKKKLRTFPRFPKKMFQGCCANVLFLFMRCAKKAYCEKALQHTYEKTTKS